MARPGRRDRTRRLAADRRRNPPGPPDGGNLARFAQATAAYYELSCPQGRAESYAGLLDQTRPEGHDGTCPDGRPGGQAATSPAPVWVYVLPPPWLAGPKGMLTDLLHRLRHGHPVGLLLPARLAAGLCLTALAIFPGLPRLTVAAVGLTWFVLAGRDALTPRPDRPREKG
ncbi:MAG: hypothetical protein ACRDOE_17365 [Streptosporangiaceae bacterium]